MGKDMFKEKWQTLSAKDTLDKLHVDSKYGLSSEEVASRQKKYSSNKIVTNGHDNVVKRFFRQFHNALIYILLLLIKF